MNQMLKGSIKDNSYLPTISN